MCPPPICRTVHAVLSVRFEKATYRVGEEDGVLEVAVVTNIAAEFSVDFIIDAENGTAIGKAVVVVATDAQVTVHPSPPCSPAASSSSPQPSLIMISLVSSAQFRALKLQF